MQASILVFLFYQGIKTFLQLPMSKITSLQHRTNTSDNTIKSLHFFQSTVFFIMKIFEIRKKSQNKRMVWIVVYIPCGIFKFNVLRAKKLYISMQIDFAINVFCISHVCKFIKLQPKLQIIHFLTYLSCMKLFYMALQMVNK